jgi:hypothetical protein
MASSLPGSPSLSCRSFGEDGSFSEEGGEGGFSQQFPNFRVSGGQILRAREGQVLRYWSQHQTVGASNNAVGDHALFANTAGGLNVAVGSSALAGNVTGSSNIGIGFFGGSGITFQSNIIAIGAYGVSSAFGEVGNACYVGNIYQKAVSSGTWQLVLVDADGKLGTFAMDADGNKATASASLGPPQQQAMLNRKVQQLEATVTQLNG